jgi:hypothetical protein
MSQISPQCMSITKKKKEYLNIRMIFFHGSVKSSHHLKNWLSAVAKGTFLFHVVLHSIYRKISGL